MVAELNRNQWPDNFGISGRILSEYSAFAKYFAAVRFDLDLNDFRLLSTGKCRVRKAAVSTVRVGKLVVFFDDGEVRTLSATVTAASSLLSPGAFGGL